MALNIDFTNKTVLITGGTRGIGASIAELFADAGANIIITGTQKETVLQQAHKIREKYKVQVNGWEVDFTSNVSFDSCCERIASLSSLDILINNAGTNHIKTIEEIKTKDLDHLMALNLRAPVILTKEVSGIMKSRQWGRIINIASIWSVITKAGRAMYTSSKFGLVGLTKSTAIDLAPYNILVNALSPGFTLTDLTRQSLSEEEQKQISAQIPLKRMAEPAEIARVALFLCSELNTYITGQNIVIDGGFVNV